MKVVVILVGCSLLLAARSSAEDLQVQPAVRAACDSVFGIRSFEQLVSQFGQPIQHRVESGLDQHAGQFQVQQHTAVFRMAHAWFALAEAMGASIQWQRFVLSERGARIPPQAWIGQSLAQISASVGPPDRVSGSRAYYGCDETREIMLVVEDDTISAVEWLGYLD